MNGKKKNSSKKSATEKLLLATAILKLIEAITELVNKLIE